MRTSRGEARMQRILSPDGNMYRSRKLALQDMILKGYKEEMKEKMILGENRCMSELLPPGWINKVAKRMERMLETALNQLKLEQKLRRESEVRIGELEKELGARKQDLKTYRDEMENVVSEKEKNISQLEGSVMELQTEVEQKDKEISERQNIITKLVKEKEEVKKEPIDPSDVSLPMGWKVKSSK